MTTPVPASPPLQSGIPVRTRLSLMWSARRDGARNIPHIEPLTDAGTIASATPRIGIIATDAEEAARSEWRHLGERIREDREYLEFAAAAKASAETRIAALSQTVLDPQAGTVEAEELRRLVREIAEIDRKVAEARARIQERTVATRLAIDHIFDRANQQVMVYWHTLRRYHRHREALAAEPTPLSVPQWLDSVPVLEGTQRPSDALPMKWTGEKRRAKN